MDINIGDLVKFKSKKWIVVDKYPDKRVLLTLAPEQPWVWRGIQKINTLTTNMKNCIKIVDAL